MGVVYSIDEEGRVAVQFREELITFEAESAAALTNTRYAPLTTTPQQPVPDPVTVSLAS